MKIAYLDPVPSKDGLPLFINELKLYASDDTEVTYHTLDGAANNYEYATFEAYSIPLILTKIKQLENEEYDAVILGCFFDPGLLPAKEIAEKIVVVGVAQASIALATVLAEQFSILIPNRKTYSHMKEIVSQYTKPEKVVSIKSLDMRVLNIQENSDTDRIMEEKIRDAIENDCAEAIVLACTMEIGKYKELQSKFKVPIVDPAIAALKFSEWLVSCRNTCGWYTSKIGTFESPDADEFKQFDFYNLDFNDK